ncbi:hypothetical protein LC048_09125 [Mesobacillus subterraneus]|uniref:hypothetical protein n=1 Tax=Mesobacillus subterraneus TaxID=285983 RepID=UPI001CFC9826|nr:hypothetical protein [Mesobacillus subterraneus]WLR57008.1 hypothetical protein LC048_09125 [Mesobacillus subterraneus]
MHDSQLKSLSTVPNDTKVNDPLFDFFSNQMGKQILIVTESSQLNILGQTFRPIFCGKVAEVEPGHLTLTPVTIKILNAPFHKFPIPISIPFEKIAHFTTDVDCSMRIPLV